MKGCYPFSPDQVLKILSYFDRKSYYAARNRALFLLGVTTGLRISESLSLKVKDVFQQGKIVDRVYVARAAMKGGKKKDKKGKKKKTISASGRSVLLNKVAKIALTELLQDFYLYSNGKPRLGTSDNMSLFHSRKGNGIQPIDRSHAWRIIKNAAFDCGIHGKIGTHSMRKTFASTMCDFLDGNIGEVQKALGHKKIDSTMQYLDFKQQNIDEAIIKLEDLYQ